MGGKRILAVEDDPAIRTLIVELLKDAGYEVGSAMTSAEALKRVAAWEPDLILLDKALPGGDGAVFVRAYRERGGRAPIVALCAAHDVAAWAESIGAAGYVAKPFDIETLIAAVEVQLKKAPAS